MSIQTELQKPQKFMKEGNQKIRIFFRLEGMGDSGDQTDWTEFLVGCMIDNLEVQSGSVLFKWTNHK